MLAEHHQQTDILLDMTVEMRKILEIKPGQTWLIILDGQWAYEAPPNHHAVPLGKASIGLLPLVERPRDEVESEARAELGPTDPDLAGPVRFVISTGLSAWSDHWISHTLRWVRPGEAELFADLLHKIATAQTAASQRTQHAAKKLLKEQGLWRPLPDRSKRDELRG
ncbi:hypothetical protein [Nonomuraea sp. NPDC005692]|uniref:hypothetical protein n=1 Tax=Nonomuraea sp. NPDC005692 TaxID=3157168 RepID=UPI0033EB774F